MCLFHPSTRNYFFLPQGTLNRVRIIFSIVCPNLIIPSTRKHIFLQSAFYRARILLVIIVLPLPIPSTRNHFFLLYDLFNRARFTLSIAGLREDIPFTLGIACLPLNIPFTRNHLCLWHQDHIGYSCPPSYCFIHQESSLSLTTRL